MQFKLLTSIVLLSSLAACGGGGGGGGNECYLLPNQAAGWYSDSTGKIAGSYVINGCGQRENTPLPQGLTPSER